MQRTHAAASVFAAALLLAAPRADAAGTFRFDDGTSQGWTAAQSDSDGAVFFGPSAAGFNDTINFDGDFAGDPVDGDGAAFAFVTNPATSADVIYLDFISPDLSGDPDWQGIAGFSGQVAPTFVSAQAYAVGARIEIEDTTGGGSVERTLAGPVQGMTLNDWNQAEMDVAGLFAGLGIDSYVTRAVIFRVAWDNPFDSELTFALDDVTPFADGSGPGDPGQPGDGGAVIPLPAPLALSALGIAALAGLRLRRRRG